MLIRQKRVCSHHITSHHIPCKCLAVLKAGPVVLTRGEHFAHCISFTLIKAQKVRIASFQEATC